MATICIAQLNYGLCNALENYNKVLSVYRECVAAHTALVLFSRYAIPGYIDKEPTLTGEFLELSQQRIQDLASHTTKTHAIVGGVSEKNGVITEAIYLMSDGKFAKVAEVPAFTCGASEECVVLNVGELRMALILEECTVGNWKVNWRKAYGNVPSDVDSVILLGRSHDGHLGLLRSINMVDILQRHENFIYLNMLGGYESSIFPGGSLICSRTCTESFKMWEEDTKVLELLTPAGKCSPHKLSCKKIAEAARDNGAKKHNNNCSNNDSLPAASCTNGSQQQTVASDSRVIISSCFGHDEFTYRTLALAVRDYVNKNGFSGVVLGLSGGIDSALVAAIAADALSPEYVYTFMLPTRYTSKTSVEDAQQCAALLGVFHEVISIEAMFNTCAESIRISTTTGSTSNGITHENMQSRIRGIYLMAVSNSMKLLLLATGNKSEICTGYMTLYGDTCGGYAPLKDIYKTGVYDLARWRNSNIPEDSLCKRGNVIPVSILEKEPSAELKPNQKDQDTLPEYCKLDAILSLLVDKRLPEKEAILLGHAEDEVKKVAHLVRKSSFKLTQTAPGPILAAIR